MRDEDKPFVCVKSRWGYNIKPRNAAGWRALGWWMVPFVIATALHMWLVAAWQDHPATMAATIVYVIVVLGWAFNMSRWMLARSVVITRGEPPKRG